MADEDAMNEDSKTEPGNADAAAGAFVPPSMEELAALLPQYEFQALIGLGGMGAVYLAQQTSLDRPVAIKVMPPVYEDQAAEAAQFITEARAMARLVHPHIVAVFDFGQTTEGHLFLVMEYVEGTDLHRMIRAGGINAGNAYALIGQLCDALQFAHDHGVAHRDIKPANILITHDGQVKIADFGLAKDITDAGIADDGLGTPDYASPERLVVGAQVDHRADIYSLGVVIHEMLSGETPRQAARHGGASLPDAFVGVMSKCLMVDPARRYQSAREVKTALTAAGQAQKAPPQPAPHAVRAPHPMPLRLPVRHAPASSGFGGIGWALACLLLFVGFGWYVWNEQRHTASTPVSQSAKPSIGMVPVNVPVTSVQSGSSDTATIAPLPEAFAKPLSPPFVVPVGPPGEVKTLTGHTAMVRRVIIMPDQRRVISSSVDGTVRVWDVEEGKQLGMFDSSPARITCVIADKDCRQLAGTGGAYVYLWDLEKRTAARSTRANASSLSPLLFSPDGSSLIIASWNSEPRLQRWTPARGPSLEAMSGWKATVKDAKAMADGRFITAGCDPVDMKWVSGEAGFGGWDSAMSLGSLASVTRAVFSVAVSPDRRTIAIADSTVDLIDLGTGLVTKKLQGLRSTAHAMEFLDGGRLLLVGGLDRSMKIFECESGKELASFDSPYYAFRTIAVSKDQRWVVTGGVQENPSVNKDPAGFALHVWRLPQLDKLGSPDGYDKLARQQLSDLATNDPELARIKSEIESGAKVASVEEMASQISEMNGKYVAALRRSAGNAAPLDQKAMLDEAARVAGGEFIDPAVADASLPPALRNMRAIYCQQILLIETTRNKAASKAASDLNAILKPLLDSREAAGDRTGAARVRALLTASAQPLKISELFGAFGAATVPKPVAQ